MCSAPSTAFLMKEDFHMQVFNRTTVVTQFILVGFSSLGELQLLLFVIFLLLYLTILVANATIMAVIRFSRTLHTPMVNHYFCDMAPVIKLACKDTHMKELALFTLSILVIMVPFLLILISYGFIVNTILKILSAEGKRKAFATCASHLTVVFVHYGCASIIYLRPKSKSASDKDQLVAVTYTVVTPLLNPLVYSLRNQEVKTSLKRFLGMPVATKVIERKI
ncbi:olfactory receptor 10T2 isoform 2-T2 [Trichechus inunguis]